MHRHKHMRRHAVISVRVCWECCRTSCKKRKGRTHATDHVIDFGDLGGVARVHSCFCQLFQKKPRNGGEEVELIGFCEKTTESETERSQAGAVKARKGNPQLQQQQQQQQQQQHKS